MARIRIELADVRYRHSLQELITWGLSYCERHREEPLKVWLSPSNYNEFVNEMLPSRGDLLASVLFFRSVPIEVDSRTGMNCVMEVDVKGALPWPPREYLPMWESIGIKDDVFEAILEPLV